MKHILEINQKLEALYGPHPRIEIDDDPTMFLILTILSQNTNDKNRDKAYDKMAESFPDSESILNAPQEELAKSIFSSGHYNMKSKRIQDVLKEIKQRQGNLDLYFLEKIPLEDAMSWLTSLPGIGTKSAAVIMNFRFKKNTFPVDTHVNRVSQRLGIVPVNSPPTKTQEFLEKSVPDHLKYSLHMNLITHGRQICKAPVPNCSNCPLQRECNYFKKPDNQRK